jgi:SAM-dependent methyltransferase
VKTEKTIEPSEAKQPAPGRLPREIASILRCPLCRAELAQESDGVRCTSCARKFPSVNGVLRFVDPENYAASFGFEWSKYARTQMDNETHHDSEIDFRAKTGFAPEELAGKLVLDVGCGTGRFAEVASRWGARVVGIDLSAAAEVAARNLAGRESVTIFQADVFQLPFAPETFDFIYSIGVLHHTPSCKAAFKALPEFLKSGGTIAIWLYSGYHHWYRCSDLYRKVTHRLPPRLLHTLCYVAVPLYYLRAAVRGIPLIGRPLSNVLRTLLPTSQHPRASFRVLDTFDWYSPKYQSKHTYEEVFRWFENCGLEALRVLHVPVAVSGRRPIEVNRATGAPREIETVQGATTRDLAERRATIAGETCELVESRGPAD